MPSGEGFLFDLFPHISYNVGMKDKEIKIRADEDFIEKVDYLQRINDYKNRSDTVRKVVEKEYRKETFTIVKKLPKEWYDPLEDGLYEEKEDGNIRQK